MKINTNHFPHFPQKQIDPKHKKMRPLHTIPVISRLLPLGKLGSFLLVSFAAHAQGYDKAPEFPGGNPGLEKYLTANVKYPEAARKKNLEGKVLIGFTVDDKGKVININVLQKVHPLLDNEATRVVRAMPRWKPATKGTQKVVAPVALPITFRLRDEPKKK